MGRGQLRNNKISYIQLQIKIQYTFYSNAVFNSVLKIGTRLQSRAQIISNWKTRKNKKALLNEC